MSIKSLSYFRSQFYFKNCNKLLSTVKYMQIITLFNKYLNTKAIFILIFSIFLLNSCGIYKRSDVKDNPINDADKRAKNINEGRGFSLGGLGKKSGTFEFASSNSMWRATIETLDFVPLSSADYGGGIIISDWYSNEENSLESYKITVVFLSNEIRADGLDVKIHKKKCSNNFSCKVVEQTSSLNTEIKLAILKKAARMKTEDTKKKVDENGSYRVVPTKKK